MAWTNGIPSPVAFRKWAAIYAVGASVRRQVWTELVNGRPIYPNLFLFLVGPPGVGKTEAITPAGEHLRKSDTAKLAPNDITKQGLLDKLAHASEAVTFPGPPPVIEEYHYMALVIRELSNFMNQYDSALAGILTDLFDNPPVNSESKRSGAGVDIVRPGLSMLAGTATKNLGKTISGDLWGQGFMSRVIMVYSADQPPVRFFQKTAVKREPVDVDMVQMLGRIGENKGEMLWSEDAMVAFTKWYEDGQQPVPNHSKLVEYNARRFLHVTKLTMIAALSHERMNIELEDFQTGRAWLEEAEAAMPEIFKEMVIHSDGEILREMHMAMWGLYSLAKRPITYGQMANFLMTKVAARDIPRLIEAAEGAKLFERSAGTSGMTATYVPQANFTDIE